jgi:hypothetical protein
MNILALGRRSVNLPSNDVRFAAQNGLKSDISHVRSVPTRDSCAAANGNYARTQVSMSQEGN